MRLLELNEALFRERYVRQPIPVRHRLGGNPLFELAELRALALRLPRASVIHRQGEVPLDAEPADALLQFGSTLSLEETFERLQEVNGYIVLDRPEQDPRFRELTEEALRQLRTHVPGLSHFTSSLVIASGNSVAPYQVARSVGLQLQVRGQRVLSLWDPNDAEVMNEVERERVLTVPNAGRPAWRDELFLNEQRIELSAGQGLSVPLIAPHLMRTLEEPSVSWELSYRSQETDQLTAVNHANRWLRRVGVQPTPHGVSPAVDFAKALGVFAVKTLTRDEDHPLTEAA